MCQGILTISLIICFSNDYVGRVTLPKMMVYAILKCNYLDEWDDEVEEWKALDGDLDKIPEIKYEDYSFKNLYDGSSESVIRIIYELFANTDFESRLDIETTYSYGGGECDIYDSVCGFSSSGITYTNNCKGELTEYAAHPYDGGFGFVYDRDRFYISYTEKKLILKDVKSECASSWDISFTNKDIKSAISYILRRGEGLDEIEEISCENITEIDVPNSVVTISDNAFEKCSSLEKVTINRINTVIGDNAIPHGVTIAGIKGSSAEAYANENDHEFEIIPYKEKDGKYYNLDEHLKIYCPDGADYSEETLTTFSGIRKINVSSDASIGDINIVIKCHKNFNYDNLDALSDDNVVPVFLYFGRPGPYYFYLYVKNFEHVFNGLYNVGYQILIDNDKDTIYEVLTNFALQMKNMPDDIDLSIPYIKAFCDCVSKWSVDNIPFEEDDGLNIEEYRTGIEDYAKLVSAEEIDTQLNNFKDQLTRAIFEQLGLSDELELDD